MRRVCLPGLLGLALLAGGASFGADQPTTTKAATTNAGAQARKAAKHTANKPVAPEGTKESKSANRTHLPPHFARIGLSAEQREQVKGVMEKYAGEIKDLEAKINDLKAKREGELHSLLTEAQKKAVDEARAAAEKARKERKAASQKVMAEGKARVDKLKAGFEARERIAQEKLAKMKAEKEKAKEAKSHPAAKETSKATKAKTKESAPAEKQPEKK
jgi:hypothetical protein